MALQSSGAISINDIRVELGQAQANSSLRSLSSLAGKSTPDAMSEFYGYSAAVYIPIYTEIFEDFGNLCSGAEGQGIVVYSQGLSELAKGDTLYADESGVLYNGGNNYHKNMNNGNGHRVDARGLVGVEEFCG